MQYFARGAELFRLLELLIAIGALRLSLAAVATSDFDGEDDAGGDVTYYHKGPRYRKWMRLYAARYHGNGRVSANVLSSAEVLPWHRRSKTFKVQGSHTCAGKALPSSTAYVSMASDIKWMRSEELQLTKRDDRDWCIHRCNGKKQMQRHLTAWNFPSATSAGQLLHCQLRNNSNRTFSFTQCNSTEFSRPIPLDFYWHKKTNMHGTDKVRLSHNCMLTLTRIKATVVLLLQYYIIASFFY